MKIGLGTVQFGMEYGLGASRGQVRPEEVRSLLDVARRFEIGLLDTARAYGSAEEVLGKNLHGSEDFQIVTKIAPQRGKPSYEIARSSFSASLSALGVNRVYGVLAHHAKDLLVPGGHELWRFLRDQREAGRVQRVGASVYTSEEIDLLLERFDIEIIQVPLSVFDQRLIKSGHLARLKDRGVEIHARSLFLQGLVLKDVADVPSYFGAAKGVLRAWEKDIHAAGASKVSGALAFAESLGLIDYAILGVTSTAELVANVEALAETDKISMRFGLYSIDDEAILMPGNWKL